MQKKQNCSSTSNIETSSCPIVKIRINKVLANAGLCSRRKADEYISNGLVSINGFCITTPGVYVQPDKDTVTFRGRHVSITCYPNDYCYLLMYKPIQVISTVKDPQGRTTILDFIPFPWKKYRLYPVGRLDFFSEGLLLITNDGNLTQCLTHPRYHISKVYHLQLREQVTNFHLNHMRKEMLLSNGVKLPAVTVQRLNKPTEDNSTWLELTLQQGLNRQIRRMCKALNLTILKLIRIRQGNLTIKNLLPGAVRPLTYNELTILQKMAQLNTPN